jgi:predicted AlkP superfamily phosphohydrolase/phosphomutase
MPNPVIAIGLDAAEPSLLEKWMSQGHLKNLRRLRDQGAYTRLKNLDYCSAETPWTTFLTGCSPQTTGYWSPLKFREGTYAMETLAAYDFSEYSPFYALGEDYRVAVFDMPQARVSNKVNGLQVLAWGAHSPQGPSESKPASLYQEIVNKHGAHPGLHNDYAECLDIDTVIRLKDTLKTGISRRSKICQDLLQREPWDLFLTVFGEPHSAGHNMWQLSQPDHPLYEKLKSRVSGDIMLEVFEAIDQAIGEIIAKAPENARVVIFSAHGMGANTMDLPSIAFLPEFLYRYNFPGKAALAKGDPKAPLQPQILDCKRNSWLWEVWITKEDSNPLRKWVRKEAPYGLFKLIERFLGPAPKPDIISPFRLMEQTDVVPYQPASWYAPYWPQMKAFALPSFSEGYVRINVKGREPQGIVDPSEYDTVCEEISQKLYALKDARTGVPMVKNIIRTRKSALDLDPKLPDGDLILVWQEEYASDVVDSPEFGRIGPLPHFRAGSHRTEGFLIASGPGIEANTSLPGADALDLTPTILKLMNAPIPEYFEGKPLLETEMVYS